MKIFGKLSLTLPKQLMSDFSVIGVEENSKEACVFTFQSLMQPKRIQTLTLINPKEELPFLKEIEKSKCKIYFFLKEQNFKEAREKYAPYGIVFLSNTPLAYDTLFQSL